MNSNLTNISFGAGLTASVLSASGEPVSRDSLAEPMRQALWLAQQAIGLSDPNPRVGCVITDALSGAVLGAGHTQAAGQAHAEVMALRDAASRGMNVRGATAWVTLEPCAHFGRTPPCCDALVAAGIAKVVVAVGDPNPLVNGQGSARLRAAGVEVVFAGPEAAQASVELNIGFFSRILRGRPWLRMKLAGSLDGRSALPDGRSQWITDVPARQDGHAWRRRAGALLTGIGTVLADNPQMDTRLAPAPLAPLRMVLDSHLRTPADARLFRSPGRVQLLHRHQDISQPQWAENTAQSNRSSAGFATPIASPVATSQASHRAALMAAGAELIAMPGTDAGLDLPAVLNHLASLNLNEVHIEAGATLSAQCLLAGMVDELLIYQAPMLLGPGRALAALPLRESLPATPEWQFIESVAVGRDLRLRLRKSGWADWLPGA